MRDRRFNGATTVFWAAVVALDVCHARRHFSGNLFAEISSAAREGPHCTLLRIFPGPVRDVPLHLLVADMWRTRWNALTVAKPIPEVPPVTRNTFPSRRPICGLRREKTRARGESEWVVGVPGTYLAAEWGL